MNPKDYLDRLGKSLKAFQPEDREKILAEVQNHLESGAEDGALGPDEHTRQARIQAEMGIPEQLGSNLQQVHRPSRWIDFLLVFVPTFLLAPLLQVIYLWANGWPAQMNVDAYSSLSLRIWIAFGLGMVVVALLRRSPWLMAFWLPDALTRTISLMTREQRWSLSGLGPETLPGYLLVIGMGYFLAVFLWRRRDDWLLALFALQPLLISLFNVISMQFAAPNYGNLMLGTGMYLINGASVVSLAGVYLLRSRDLRWLSFAVMILADSLVNILVYWPHSGLVSLWLLLTALVLFAWYVDLRQRQTLARQQIL